MSTQLQDCTYMTSGMTMPFCKGCGHGHILKKLNDALETLAVPAKDVCLVTDIGCIGLADALFDKVHTVHTTHGRSTAFATGIALADAILKENKLKTIVLIGDGGSMIGLLHIVNAALLNADVTVLVANNFLFGMTGGQQSSFSPMEFITQTTPEGNIIPPLDICKIVTASKGTFTARMSASDKLLTGTIADAIQHKGFSLIEILELCPEHAVAKNALKGTDLERIAEEHGHELGVLFHDTKSPSFGEKYLALNSKAEAKPDRFIGIDLQNSLTKKTGIIIAGSAGERVQSTAALLCEAAVTAGLYVTQKNDNPVTQGSGFSLSEVILSPDEIDYTGVEVPDVVIVVSEDGMNELKMQGVTDRISEQTIVYADESVTVDGLKGKVVRAAFRKYCSGAKAALGAVDYFVKQTEPFAHERFRQFIERRNGEYAKVFKPEFYNL